MSTKCITAVDVTIFRPNINNINRRFINYIFNSDRTLQYIKRLSGGSTRQRINRTTLSKIVIPLPPLQEQKKIASILTTVDDKITAIEEQVQQTEQLKKGLMRKLLTEGIGHTEFKDTKIGRIPKSWDVNTLGEVSEFSNGKAHEKAIDENGEYIVVNSKFISTEGKVVKFSNENLCPLYCGDIVMVMSDIPNGRALAKCFLIDTDATYTLNQRICSIKAVKSDNLFLFDVIDRNKYYLKFDNGVGQTNLRKSEVLQCPVPLPPLEEQKQIASILTTVDNKIDVLTQKKSQFQTLKKGLSQQLLTGQMRVKV